MVLSLPPSFDVNSTALLQKLMTALVDPWEPEWAVVCSSAARNARQDDGPFLHKALYLRSDLPLPPDLPSDAVTCNLGQGRVFLPAQLT